MFNVKSSIVRFNFGAVEFIVSPLVKICPAACRATATTLRLRTAFPLSLLLHPTQLMLPVPLKRAGPLVQRPDRLRVHSVHHFASLPSYVHQPNVQQHPKMFRHRRLFQLQRRHNLAHRPLLQRQVVQYVAPPRLGDCVKCVRRCSRSRHAPTIHSYMGICQGVFFFCQFEIAGSTATLSGSRLCGRRAGYLAGCRFARTLCSRNSSKCCFMARSGLSSFCSRLISSAPSSELMINSESCRGATRRSISCFLMPSAVIRDKRFVQPCNAFLARARNIGFPSSASTAVFISGQPPGTRPARLSTKLSIVFFSRSTQSGTSATPSNLPRTAFSHA